MPWKFDLNPKPDTEIQIPTTHDQLPRHENECFDKFMRAVANGDLRAGMTMTQAELCDFLGISRSPLREALTLLEEYGLIEVRQRSGISIVQPELSFVREKYQFRIIIEVEAMREFVETVSDAWLDKVLKRHQELIEMMEGPASDPDVFEAFVTLDSYMHLSFVEALKNRTVLDTHIRLLQNIRMVRATQEKHSTRNMLLKAAQEHLELLDKIRERDFQSAADCLRRHFEASIYRTVLLS